MTLVFDFIKGFRADFFMFYEMEGKLGYRLPFFVEIWSLAIPYSPTGPELK
jgi:hypothetical protein